MATPPEKRFSFLSAAVAVDTFAVVRFRGEEGLSRCYRFEVELAAQDANLDDQKLLTSPATFVIHRAEGDVPFHGILTEFRQLHQAGVYTLYQAVLVPKLWWLSLTHHNQVFLDQTMPQMVETCLKDGGLTAADFEQRLQWDRPSWEYACQYRESHLAFVSCLMEKGGVYYYFEQGGSAEKLILTDTKVAHGPMPEGETLRYRALAAMEHFHREEVIWGFESRRRLLPKSLLVKDYNPDTPSLDLSASAPVSPDGRGEWYLYGEHFLSPEEGRMLAAMRAQELLCRERQFSGESAIPFLRPGYTFQLQDHYRDSFNQAYLTVSLAHEGSQAAYLLAGLGIKLAPGEEEPYYRNRFTAIPASVQFRPEQVTEKARFYGAMNAKIDASGSGQYAELDDLGRYKVILPFDLSGRKDGKASAWLRMMQPYAGSGHGMHFPLHKGTEVLLAFIDGDPDRPVIAGAIPNPATPSPVTGENQTMSVLQTGGKNRMAIEDKAGSERFLFHVPNQGVYLRIGAPNDPVPAPTPTPAQSRPGPPTPTPSPSNSPTATPDFQKEIDELKSEVAGLKAEMEGDLEFKCHNKRETVSGNSFIMVIGADEEIFLGNYTHIKMVTNVDITVAVDLEAKVGGAFEFNTWQHTFFEEKTELGMMKTELRSTTNRLVGQVVEMVGENTKMIGNNMRMIGEHQMMLGQLTKMAGGENVLKGNRMIAMGEDLKIEGTKVVSCGQRTETSGENIEMAGSKNRVVINEMSVATSYNQTALESTQIASESTNLNGLKLML